jgi:hypothetical protein
MSGERSFRQGGGRKDRDDVLRMVVRVLEHGRPRGGPDRSWRGEHRQRGPDLRPRNRRHSTLSKVKVKSDRKNAFIAAIMHKIVEWQAVMFSKTHKRAASK